MGVLELPGCWAGGGGCVGQQIDEVIDGVAVVLDRGPFIICEGRFDQVSLTPTPSKSLPCNWQSSGAIAAEVPRRSGVRPESEVAYRVADLT